MELMYVWWMVLHSLMALCKYVIMEHGGVFVDTSGVILKHKWFADNLDFHQQVSTYPYNILVRPISSPCDFTGA